MQNVYFKNRKLGGSFLEDLEQFLAKVAASSMHFDNKKRAMAIITKWSDSWTGSKCSITYTFSNHGAFLRFNQLIGSVWSHVFVFHISSKHSLVMRGPDTDRIRKSHKHKDNPIDRSKLDAVFTAWSMHPEAKPAGNAVEFYLEETPDEVWEVALQELLTLISL